MAVAKVTIDVDLGELEKYCEAVAFRAPTNSEFFVAAGGGIVQCDCLSKYSEPRLIVRRKFVWPSWCKAAAICKDKHSGWWMYETMPKQGDESWSGGASCAVLALNTATQKMLGIALPENHDWTVPIVNPNYKAGGDE